jgi:hypothetical protein
MSVDATEHFLFVILEMEAVSISETSTTFLETARRNITKRQVIFITSIGGTASYYEPRISQ